MTFFLNSGPHSLLLSA